MNSITDFNEMNGKTLALIAEEEAGGGVAFNGIARWDGRHLYWDRVGVTQPIEIPEHRLGSVRRTSEEDRALLGDVEYLVFLSISNLPEGEPLDAYVKTGLQWPS